MVTYVFRVENSYPSSITSRTASIDRPKDLSWSGSLSPPFMPPPRVQLQSPSFSPINARTPSVYLPTHHSQSRPPSVQSVTPPRRAQTQSSSLSTTTTRTASVDLPADLSQSRSLSPPFMHSDTSPRVRPQSSSFLPITARTSSVDLPTNHSQSRPPSVQSVAPPRRAQPQSPSFSPMVRQTPSPVSSSLLNFYRIYSPLSPSYSPSIENTALSSPHIVRPSDPTSSAMRFSPDVVCNNALVPGAKIVSSVLTMRSYIKL